MATGVERKIEIEYFNVVNGGNPKGGDSLPATATLIVKINEERKSATANGGCSVDAIVKAMRLATGIEFDVKNPEIHTASNGDGVHSVAKLLGYYKDVKYYGTGHGMNENEALVYGCLDIVNQIQ